jgi:hypothetical protein
VGIVEASGGFPGEALYDSFTSQMHQLKNQRDIVYLDAAFPNVINDTDLILHQEHFLTTALKAPGSSFVYEAVIALGLAACDTANDTFPFDGHNHYNHLKTIEFEGLSGRVQFDRETGSRDPATTMFAVTNYVSQTAENDQISFAPAIHYQSLSKWRMDRTQAPSNDNSTNPPADIPPVEPLQNFLLDGLHIGTLVMVGTENCVADFQ